MDTNIKVYGINVALKETGPRGNLLCFRDEPKEANERLYHMHEADENGIMIVSGGLIYYYPWWNVVEIVLITTK